MENQPSKQVRSYTSQADQVQPMKSHHHHPKNQNLPLIIIAIMRSTKSVASPMRLGIRSKKRWVVELGSTLIGIDAMRKLMNNMTSWVGWACIELSVLLAVNDERKLKNLSQKLSEKLYTLGCVFYGAFDR